ncbi:MAG: CoA transferase [Chloroflexi bacterium]|nr:CoA transferase [Chloroflexota bacterium]
MAKKAFEGIKCLDFGWIGVGPVPLRLMGDHGATVVRLESHTAPETARNSRPYIGNTAHVDRAYWFADWNSSKLGLSIDLSKPRGKEIAWKLIRWADIITEGMTTKTMRNWGMDYESVRKVRPDIIYLSTTVKGQTGPHHSAAGHGTLIAALAGISSLVGWPDRYPLSQWGAYTDMPNWRLASAAILAALDYRRRTGKGQFIDYSQFEGALHLVAPTFLEYAVNGRLMERNGNRWAYAVPHGAFPCQGDNRWVALSVGTDKEWHSLCQAMGDPALAQDSRFATFMARKRHEDELERIVAGWTKQHTTDEVVASLQTAGVASSVVESVKDLFEDDQLQHRRHFRWLLHATGEKVPHEAWGFQLSKTPDTMFAAPAMGQHNEYVLKEILGYADEDIAQLLMDKVVTTEDDLPKA